MRIFAAVLLLSAGAGSAMAQQTGVVTTPAGQNERVATTMRNTYTRYEGPKCEAADDDLHFKVSSGKTYLKTGLETSVDDNKKRALANGQRVITEAITQNGQASHPGAWYFLGRIYIQQGDLAGADSAFAKAVALAPECAEDIDTYRRNAWVALVNPAMEFVKAKQTDSAVALLNLANRVFRGAPHAYFTLGSISYDAGNMEQALVYFDSALAVPRAPKDSIVYDQSQFNRAVVLLNLNRGQDAVPSLQEFVAGHPDDINAKKALRNAYQAAGMTDSVVSISKQLEAAGEPMPAATVVVDTASPFNQAVALFNANKFAEAAAQAEKVVASEPHNRDAYYLLTQSYYQTKNGPALVKAGERLIALDPMNELALQMLGFGYNLTRASQKAVDTRLRLNALPMAIGKVVLTPTPTGASLTAVATGRKAMNAQGAPIAPKPVTLKFEFLNADGAVVTSKDVELPAHEAGATHDIAVTAEGTGIVAWRYSAK
ncbi:MAG TPA: tetratricopeptide repeat protein [Gemmatimonadales bacterium]|nr:tetratricopeptide repeat protein [Gemmatimonadales bacterium]